MPYRNSASEENLLSRLGGIRNAVDETKSLRAKNERLHEQIAVLIGERDKVRAVLREVLHYAPYELQREGKAVREIRHLLPPADLRKRAEEAAR